LHGLTQPHKHNQPGCKIKWPAGDHVTVTKSGRPGSSSYDPDELLSDVVWLLARRGLTPTLASRDLAEARSLCARLLTLVEVRPGPGGTGRHPEG
jgi:hypothetical protein